MILPGEEGGGDAAQLDRPAWKRSVTQLMVSEGTHGSSERRIVRIVDAQGPERVRKHRQAARRLVVLLVVAIVAASLLGHPHAPLLLAPLYARLRGASALENGKRARLLAILRERPGMTVAESARALGCDASTARDHF